MMMMTKAAAVMLGRFDAGMKSMLVWRRSGSEANERAGLRYA